METELLKIQNPSHCSSVKILLLCSSLYPLKQKLFKIKHIQGDSGGVTATYGADF
jgi:hypothetical protein